ncbi:YegS/Rv2252/BmrU family lipid kinase [Metabacillus litoralis]|uniref:YegS/Rv2252/BmrU family lipid kinase n=1 Tax=Metabacillus litoralis TaxID=152268 RepID=A0A5C6VY76_9BACI|nr:YegS/Rv2252/BmrU family lipid kinase [Metabacillus litoralis]TXC90262.1 YegS/Rv2252/BmrU family lipid kinase [Metabacillus litoralis]
MNGLFFIINIKAGHGKSLKTWRKVKKELEKNKVSYRSFYTEYAGHAEVLVRQIAAIQNYRLKTIIGIGGDGTINEIINGLTPVNKIQIGFIYAGSGKDSSRGTKLPSNSIKAVKYLRQQFTKPLASMDLGDFHLERKGSSRTFINRLGIGLNAELVDTKAKTITNTNKSFLIKRIKFMTSLIKVLLNYQPFTIHMTIDGELISYENVWFITISNRPNTQWNMLLSPNANSNDGYIDVAVVSDINRYQLFFLLLTPIFSKKLKGKAVKEIICQEVAARSEGNILLHADGDVVGECPVKISVKKSHASIII